MRELTMKALILTGGILLLLFTGCSTVGEQYDLVIEQRAQELVREGSPESLFRIDEVCLWNDTLLEAADGSFPDWVEIGTEERADLKGWRLVIENAAGEQTRFSPFPELVITDKEPLLLVFLPSRSSIPARAVRLAASIPQGAVRFLLVDPEGNTRDTFVIPELPPQDEKDPPLRDVSAQRDRLLTERITFTSSPTPGLGYDSRVAPPRFVYESGVYEQPLLEFDTRGLPEGARIWYTINDGASGKGITSDREWDYPTPVSGIAYDGPVVLSPPAVIKARVYTPQGTASATVTRSYLDDDSGLPVVSLAVDPYLLWDPQDGIYVIGQGETPNFREKRYVTAFTEFLTSEGNYADSLSMRLYGSSSKVFVSKSMALYANVGESGRRIPNLFFEGSAKDIPEFYSLILRNSGGDFLRTMVRDRFMTSLADPLQVRKQDSAPSMVYLNGEYWGILNIREKINEYFIEDHEGLDPDSLDIVEGSYRDTLYANEGDLQEALRLYEMSESLDPRVDEVYELFDELIDLESLIDYLIIQSFINNTDWPWSNIKMYRERSDGAKWRFILFDTDAGFDTREYFTREFDPEQIPLKGRADYDMIEYLASGEASNYLAVLFSKLIRNERFNSAFILRYEELLEDLFTPEVLRQRLDEVISSVDGVIDRHLERWSVYDPVIELELMFTRQGWEDEVSVLYEFAELRPGYVAEAIERFEEIHRPLPSDLILGGEFEPEYEGYWNLRWSDDKSEQTIIPGEDPFGRIVITDGQQDPWDIAAFVYDGIFVDSGERLTFEVDLWTDSRLRDGEYVRITLFDPESGRTLFSEDVIPTTTRRGYRIGFTNQGDRMLAGRLQFRVGTLREGCELYIDSVKLED